MPVSQFLIRLDCGTKENAKSKKCRNSDLIKWPILIFLYYMNDQPNLWVGSLWLAGCGSQDFNPQTWKSKRGYLIQFPLLCALTLPWGLVQQSQAMLHFGRELREEGSTHKEGRKKEKNRASRHPHTQKRKEKEDDMNNTI
jgi:hypothetical protein